MTQTKTLNFGISQNILTKVPRYFGSPQAILRELFQNSWRAGARNVDITYQGNALRFTDDGCGSDAENFLIAGEWAIPFAIRVLQSRSGAIEMQLKKTIQRRL